MAKQLAEKLDFQNRSENMNVFICKVSDALGKIHENVNVKKIGKELKFIELEKMLLSWDQHSVVIGFKRFGKTYCPKFCCQRKETTQNRLSYNMFCSIVGLFF